MNIDFLAELEQAAVEMRQQLMVFTPEQLNHQPAEGWSAGQTAEHVLKSVAGVPQVLAGGHKPAGRDPQAMVTNIREIFLDFDTKMKSPEFILPSQHPPAKNELLKELQKYFDQIQSTAKTIDLSHLLTDYPFPQVGEMTGYEWLCFVAAHTKRHTVQIGKIYQGIAEKDIVT